MMISSDYDKILRVLKFCGEIITSYEKLFLGTTFLIVNRFSKFLQHILGQTKPRLLLGDILPTVK